MVADKQSNIEDAEKIAKVCSVKQYRCFFFLHNQEFLSFSPFKVKEVFECVQKLEPLVAVLPSIINRLISLKKLHEEGSLICKQYFYFTKQHFYYKNFFFIAANISQTVTQLENTQKSMDLSLNTQCQLLSDIQLGLATNMQTMKTAIEELETKLSTKKKWSIYTFVLKKVVI